MKNRAVILTMLVAFSVLPFSIYPPVASRPPKFLKK